MVWHKNIAPDKPGIGLRPRFCEQGVDVRSAENRLAVLSAHGHKHNGRAVEYLKDRLMGRRLSGGTRSVASGFPPGGTRSVAAFFDCGHDGAWPSIRRTWRDALRRVRSSAWRDALRRVRSSAWRDALRRVRVSANLALIFASIKIHAWATLLIRKRGACPAYVSKYV